MSAVFDVAIVGGGLVGASAGIALARAGRRVALIEAAARQDEAQPSYDDRTLVINAASLNILGALDLLPESADRCPIEGIEISRAGQPGHVSLRASDHGRSCFGEVIVARRLGACLLEALAGTPDLAEYCPARLAGMEIGHEQVQLGLEDGQSLSARLVIGADGNHSRVRDLAGLHCDRHAYGESAMIFNVQPERVAPGIAHERFTDRGPLALLPQPAGRCGVVWIDRDAAIDQAMQLDDEPLCRALGERFGPALGRFSRPGKRARYSLVRQRTPRPIADRCVLIGNAANAVHPVSAQGFNLGLRDVAGLVDALAGHADPGQSETLEHYARLRQDDQEATVRYTDTLARAFTNPSVLARLATSFGLVAHAGLPGLRHRLVRAAMGFREPVASLARDRQPERAA